MLSPLDTLHTQRHADILSTLANELVAECGVHPFTFYCLHTGAPLGTMSRVAVERLSVSLPYDIDNPDSWDDIKSELLTRCYAMARPGPAWGFVSPSTIGRLMATDLHGSLTYLLFRLWEPLISSDYNLARGQHAWASFEAKAEWLHRKITLAQRFAEWPVEEIRPLVALLCRADGLVGLHKLPLAKHFGIDSFLEPWSPTLAGDVAALKRTLHAAIDRANTLHTRTGNTLSARAAPMFAEHQSPATRRSSKSAPDINLVSNLFKAWASGGERARKAKDVLAKSKTETPALPAHAATIIRKPMTFKIKRGDA